MKKINKLFKLVPAIALVGTVVPMVSLTGCKTSEAEQTTFTVSYGSTPAGLSWGVKLSSVEKGNDFTVSYALDPGYSLETSSCVVKVGDTDVSSSCTFTNTELTIPASVITGNIKITLYTSKTATSYSITYGAKPTGLTWTTQPKSIIENTGVSAEYTLADTYSIDKTNSDITVGGTSIKNKITYNSGAVNIPAKLVTGDIVINLATKKAATYTVTYEQQDVTWTSQPGSATEGAVFTATFSLAVGYIIDTSKTWIKCVDTTITDYCTFRNGTVIVPADYVTGNLTIHLEAKTEVDDHTYVIDGESGTVTFKAETANTVYTLAAADTSGSSPMNITLSGTWLNASIQIKSAGTYNITLDDCTICNGASSDETAEAPINITKKATGAIVNFILPENSESSINDRRTDTTEGYYEEDYVIRHNDSTGAGSLNFKGNGILNINNINTNKGVWVPAIKTKTDVTISDKATINAFAYDTCIQVGGLLTVSNANVIADSYYDDAIKTKSLDPDEDFAGEVGRRNSGRDIVVTGGSTIRTYSARNGINAAHNFTSQSDDTGTPTIETYTGYANAGSKVYNNDQIDEQNIYVAIPSSCFDYDDIEKYFFVIDFYDTAEATYGKHNEYMSLKKIRKDNGYYFFKCGRPVDSNIPKFKIYMYEISQWGTEASCATSGEITIPSPSTYTNTNDCIKVTSISTSAISTSSSKLDCNYVKLRDNDDTSQAKVDTVISSKGIKAKNNIQLDAGAITLQTLDTCMSCGYGEIFCNSKTEGDVTFGSGNITISGANVVGTSTSGDGIKAYGVMNVEAGTTTITKSVEALEAGVINIKGGIIKLSASDDGMNASQTGKYTTSMLSINVSGGILDVQTTSTNDTDAIDSNNAISVTGGLIIARVPGSSPSSAFDCETKSVSMSGATLICMGTVEPTINGPSSTTKSGVYKAKSYTVTYYISQSTTNTYTFTNDTAMNSSCKVFYNYKAPTIA